MQNHNHYAAFYPHRSLWVGGIPDLSSYNSKNYLVAEFPKLMSEVVFEETYGDWEVRICKDGMIMFSDEKINNHTTEDFEIMNARWEYISTKINILYFNLDMAILQSEGISFFDVVELSNKDIISLSIEDGQMKSMSMLTQSYAHRFQKERFLSTYDLSRYSDLNQYFVSESKLSIIDKKVFDIFIKNLKLQEKSDCDSYLLYLFIKAISNLKLGHYKESLLSAWFVIESIVNIIWETYLEESLLNNSRKNKLKKSSDYTIAIKTSILTSSDFLTEEFASRIDAVRGKRNMIVHQDSGYNCSLQDCSEASTLVNALIKEQFGLKLTINLSQQLSGI